MGEKIGCREAARLLGVNKATVRRAAQKGRVRAQKTDNGWRIDRDHISDFRQEAPLRDVAEQLSRDVALGHNEDAENWELISAIAALIGKDPVDLKRRAYALIDYVRQQRSELGISDER